MATVVLDADGVLWAGIITYGDPVVLVPGIRETLKELKKRGHAIVICSRNDDARLHRALMDHALMPYVDQAWATWGPKSSWFTTYYRSKPTVFVDDNHLNCVEIATLFPDVHVIEVDDGSWDPLLLLEHPVLTKKATPEDASRVRLLREQQQRETAEAVYTGPYLQFLSESQLRLTIYRHEQLPDPVRALDLLNRTNELKTSPNRYESLPADRDIITASLVDRYGDYGLIAVAVVDRREPVHGLDDLAVSCRTMGRGIGTAIVAWICQDLILKHWGVGLVGVITPTDQNGPMRDLYKTLGFTLVPIRLTYRSGGHHGDETLVEERWIWQDVAFKTFLPKIPEWIDIKEAP